MKVWVWAALLAAVAVPASGANFSGKWAIENAGGRGGGRGGPTILELNQVGDKTTGTIALRIDAGSNSPVNMEILGGKVEGYVLSFYVWMGTDRPTKVIYSGTMSGSGDEIDFTITGAPTPAGLSGPAHTNAGVQQKAMAKRTK